MKKILLTLLAFMVTVAMNAEQVSKQQALQKAQQFMPGKRFGEARTFARSAGSSEGEPFYVFNAEGNQGFVIVSGDDRTTEILGYSKTGSLDLNQLPENLKGWLDDYARQIEALGTTTQPVQRAKTRGADSWEAVDPLIKTKWDQYYPYNMMCPDLNGKDWRDKGFDTEHLLYDNYKYHCVTGCVATAMAQIMYYHKHPSKCPALDEYTTGTKGWTMKALPEADFEWAKMKETYVGNETDESADAVAVLMRYCGQAIEMDYNMYANGGSAGSVSAEVLADVFGYSKNIRGLWRDSYSTSRWEEIIYTELAAGRPVLYSGRTDKGGGHEFIIDGYDGIGLFHINWGWGGSSADYFVLSLAEPKVQGAGGGKGAYQFSQTALIGVQPGSSEEKLIPEIESIINAMTQNYTRTSADVDFTDVQFNGFANANSKEDFNIQIGWALCQNGQIIKVVKDSWHTFTAGYSYGENTSSTVTFGAGLASGKYEVCQVYRYSEDAVWLLCEPYYNTLYYVAELTETSLSLHEAQPSFKVTSMVVSENPSTGSPMEVTLNVTNDGDTFEQVIRLLAQKEGDSNWTLVAKATRKIDPGKSEDVVMSYTPTVAGNYTLRVTNDKSDVALNETTVTVYAAFNKTVDNLKFVCHSGTKKARLVGHTYGSNGNNVEVNIPSAIDEYTVNEIADDAFERFYRLSAVTIPETVETIGDGAFFNCNRLSELTVPKGVKRIGESAFYACYSLQTVNLPSSLTSIGDKAFYRCPLSSVVVAMQNPIKIDRNVFLTTEEVDGEDVEVFTSADLIVPIGQKAAYSIAEAWKEFSTIYQGELKDITLNDITYSYVSGEDFAIVMNGDPTALEDKDVVIPSTITAGEKTYKVKRIADNAFFKIYMKTLTIQQGVEEIGESAFWNNNGINKVIIPAGVKRIGASAFQYCFGLRSLELPASLTSIGEYAFGTTNEYGTSYRLTSVVSYISIPFDIADNVFGIEDGDNMLAPTATLTVPYGTKTKYEAAAGWKLFQPITEMESQGTPGDANGDGDVDADDIDAIVRYIITGDTTNFVFDNANLNGDNKVDAADLVLLIKTVNEQQNE